MFVFPHAFPVLWKSTFSMFWEVHEFLLHTKNRKALNFDMFVFSHIFSLLWEFTFLIFWEWYGLMRHTKYVRNLWLWNVSDFPYVSLTMRIRFSHVIIIV